MLGLLSTIVRLKERSDQESVRQEKIALSHEHNLALITSTSAREVACISAKRLGHPARTAFFLDFSVCLPPLVTEELTLGNRGKFAQVSLMKSTTKLS